MKRLLITVSALCILLADPSPVGNWKLSGLEVEYTHITREEVTLTLNDAYGFGVEVPVLTIPSGVIFQTITSGPYSMEGAGGLTSIGVNLNVNVYPDGSGAVAEGSFYPDIDLIPGTCITDVLIFPVSDTFSWETNEDVGEVTFANSNVVKTPSPSGILAPESENPNT